MTPLKVTVVTSSKMKEMSLEQQIARVLEGKLLHTVTISSRCYVDLIIPVYLSFKF